MNFDLLQSAQHSKANLTFIVPCIANIYAQYNQQDEKFHNLFISVRSSTCFRLLLLPAASLQVNSR